MLSSHRRTVQWWVLAGILAIAAIQRSADGLFHLLWLSAPPVDLAIRWREVHRWFAGQSVYGEHFAVYPPASYALLWPAVGWVDLTGARWLWAVATVVALGSLAWLIVRESGARRPATMAVVAVFPFAAYTARAVMVNGQLALHLLPPLLAGLLLLARRPPAWSRDLAGAALLLVALTKPTLTAPFMWIVATARRPVRPAALVLVAYAGLTLYACAFQPASPLTLLTQFAGGAVGDAARAARESHANLHAWIASVGVGRGYTAASLATLLALGWWTWAPARHSDIWLRLGVAALIARFWTFHYRYDDVLVLVPVVTLIRMLNPPTPGERPDRAALLVLVLVAATLLIPARVFFPPWPWKAIEALQTAIWLVALGFLVHRARPSARSGEIR